MAGKGGARQGAGRPTKAVEDKITQIATSAIVEKYGSMEGGFKALLVSGEPSLIKFAFEHAAGKPKDRLEHSSVEGQSFRINGQEIHF